MTKTFQIIVFLLIAFSINAQDSLIIQKKHQICIATGLSKHIIQDYVISPLIYKGIKAPIWIKYKYYGAKFNHSIFAYFNQPELECYITNKKSSNPHYTENINGYLSYCLNRKIYSLNKYNTDIFIGGKIKHYINYRTYYISENYPAETSEQNTSLDFMLQLNKRYNSNEDLMNFTFNIPIVARCLTLGMYNANVSTNFDSNFVSLNKLFEFQSELSIYKSLNNTVAFGLSYYFHFYSFEKHVDLNRTKYTNSQLLIEILIKL